MDVSSIDKAGTNSKISGTDTYNNRDIDRPDIDKSGVNAGINKNNGESSNKNAKIEEDIKKEPIIQAILDIFDGELLNQ